MSSRPERCRFPDKSWLTKIQAMRKAEQYGMKWYRCYDHYHIGHGRDEPTEEITRIEIQYCLIHRAQATEGREVCLLRERLADRNVTEGTSHHLNLIAWECGIVTMVGEILQKKGPKEIPGSI